MEAELILRSLTGKTISSIIRTSSESRSITINFTDGSDISIDADGDDMSHTVMTVTDDARNIIYSD